MSIEMAAKCFGEGTKVLSHVDFPTAVKLVICQAYLQQIFVNVPQSGRLQAIRVILPFVTYAIRLYRQNLAGWNPTEESEFLDEEEFIEKFVIETMNSEEHVN